MMSPYRSLLVQEAVCHLHALSRTIPTYTGKTKVLTSRISHLVQNVGIPPSRICAVTFTNKAANEMRARLQKLIGLENTNKLQMGMSSPGLSNPY